MPRMRKTEPRPVEVLFVLRRPGGPLNLTGCDCNNGFYGEDHLAIVSPEDIEQVAEPFVRGITWQNKIGQLNIVCPLEDKCDITPILNMVRDRVTPQASLRLHGALVSAELLARILSEWLWVDLVGCELGEGWAQKPRSDRRCQTLELGHCTAAADKLTVGCAAWPALQRLSIDEDIWDATLYSPNSIMPEGGKVHRSAFPPGTASFAKAFGHAELDQLQVSHCPDISFLAEMPPSNATSLTFDGSPMDNTLLAWVASHRKVLDIDISWKPDIKLHWRLLGPMRKLRSIDVTGSPFSDEDLAELAPHTRLKVIWCYYTRLTPASWPLVFSMPSLRQIWVSTEMLEGPMPSGLPPSTNLIEVVSMNVGHEHTEYLKKLLDPYPNVLTHDM